MSKIIILSFLIFSMQAKALNDAEYKAEFRKNYYVSCYKEMTTGDDKVEPKFSSNYCACMADKFVTSLTISELKKLDKNPFAFKDLMASYSAKCMVEKIK